MDAVLRNFSLIPCPSGDRCTATNCLWQHETDESPLPATAPTSVQDEGGPRKRLKTSSTSGPQAQGNAQEERQHSATITRPISPPELKHKVPSATPGSLKASTTSDQVHLPTTPAKVNPFAQHPKSLLQKSASQALPSQTTTPEASTLRTGTPSSLKLASKSSEPEVKGPARPADAQVSPAQKAATRKPETLNPRHLKSAPAPHDFRYKAVKMLHDNLERLNNEAKKSTSPEDKRITLSSQELIWMALDMEQKMAIDKPAVYTNVIKNKIQSYRRMTYAEWKAGRQAELKKAEDALKSTQNPIKSSLGPPKEVNTGLTPKQEVEFVAQFLVTPITELAQYGYVPVAPTDKAISEARDGEEAGGGWEKCDRCQTRFQVFPGRREDGALTSGGKCVYHYGRAFFPEKTLGQVGRPEREYRCCGQPLGESSGCVEGPCHVFKAGAPSRLAALLPFMETPPNPSALDGAVCFDCEMAYTVRGLELIRLTATSWPDGRELLDVLVHPVGEILDLNSRFSGVWPDDMVKAEPWVPGTATQCQQTAGDKKKRMKIVDSPAIARDLLFSLISPTTPLIGHGLENDLNACRIIHPTVVDTILLFPHKKGLPIRNGLKNLMGHHLNKVIQLDTGEGHDSAEDARAAGELVRLKVQEKWRSMQTMGWKVEGDGFVAPPGKAK